MVTTRPALAAILLLLAPLASAGHCDPPLVDDVVREVNDFLGHGDPAPCPDTDHFCDLVDGAGGPWTVSNSLNEWRIESQAWPVHPLGEGASSGAAYWYVGAPGAAGVSYRPADGPDGSLGTGSTITSPAFTIPSPAASATLSVAISGGSEACFDFLEFF